MHVRSWKRIGVSMAFLDKSTEERCNYKALNLIYVLEGSAQVIIGADSCQLGEKDVIAINAGKRYKLILRNKPLVCCLSIDYHMLLEETGKAYAFFWCNSTTAEDVSFARLRDVLNQMLMEYLAHKDCPTLHFRSLQFELLNILIDGFMLKSSEQWGEQSDSGQQMLQYIGTHYRQPLTLQMLADKFYLSLSTCSRSLNKLTGMSFNQYLNQIRLQYAIDDLLHTDQSMTVIAMNHGFATPSSFNRVFRQTYGMSPTQYQLKYKPVTDQDRITSGRMEMADSVEMLSGWDNESDLRLEKYFETIQLEENLRDKSVLSIEADAGLSVNYIKPANMCMNFGMASDLLSAQIQSQLRMFSEILGIRYIRIGNIFGESMHLKKDRDLEHLNFDKMDMVLDAVIDNGFYPWLELGNKPKQVLKNIHESIIFDKSNPLAQNTDEWQMILKRFFEHIRGRYGERKIEGWKFELWYDDQLPFEGNADVLGYTDMWQAAWEAVHKYAPRAQIGGIGCSVGSYQQTIRRVMGYWKAKGFMPDFLTVCSYPYVCTGSSHELCGHRQVNTDFLKDELTSFKNLMAEMDFSDMPVFVSEWNTSLSERNYYNDSYMKAAQMAYHINSVYGLSEVIAYGNGTDMISQYFDSGRPFSGALGLVNKDSIKKPAFYILEYFNHLGNRLIERGSHYIITSNHGSSYYVLLFHPQKFSHVYYLKDENEFQAAEQEHLYEPMENKLFHIKLDHVDNGSYFVKRRTINKGSGDVLNEWCRLGCAEELSREDITYLEHISVPHISIDKQTVYNRQLDIYAELEPGEVSFYHIYQ